MAGGRRNSSLKNYSVEVGGKTTGIRLEAQMWQCLQEVARREGKSIRELLTEINQRRRESTLTAAIRVYVVRYFQEAATEEGHRQAGHGARR